MNILVVDDEEYMRTMISETLKDEKLNIFLAENITQAREFLGNENIDLLITDLVMPEINGIDLIMEVRKNRRELPIIAISGGGGISGRFEYLPIAELLGAKYILEKPFDVFQLKEMVDEFITC